MNNRQRLEANRHRDRVALIFATCALLAPLIILVMGGLLYEVFCFLTK